MVKRNASDGETLNLDFSDLIYRSNLRIMENEAFGNHSANYAIISYLDTILAPFRDAEYWKDVAHIREIKPGKYRTPWEKKKVQTVCNEVRLRARHEVLMCLAYRNGFLGNKKAQNFTGIDHSIEVDDE